MSITITLPYPPSANNLTWNFVPKGWKRSIRYPTDEAKAYKDEVAWLCKKQGIKEPIKGRVSVHIQLYPERPKDADTRAAKNPTNWDDDIRCIDLDNARKVVNDALNKIAFEDDFWIWLDSAERMEPDGKARVVVTIEKVLARTPQLALLETENA